MKSDVAEAILTGLSDGTIEKGTAIRILQMLTQDVPIAVIGLGARTSRTDDYRQVWETVRAGGSDLRRCSATRGEQISSVMPPGTCEGPGDLSKGAYLEDLGSFDHELFGFSEAEAAQLMPHAKVVLTTAFRALEDAGHLGEAAAGNRTGVYVGYNNSKDQVQSFLGVTLRSPGAVDHQKAIFGSWTSGIATRVSRAFDLRGPAYMIDAACSSSTTALSTACDALRGGVCDTAVAGGFYIDVTPVHLYNQSGLATTPGDGSVTKLYDRRNVGMYNGEYAGFAVLKQLDKALEDGDRIHGLIHAWSMSNNGADGRFDQNAPDAVAQSVVDLLKSATFDVEDIGLVMGEGYAHPMEEALDTLGVLEGVRRFTDRKQFAALTALTPNFGYLQSAVGIADLTVMVQALRDRQIPPLPHFDTPTDLIDLIDSPYYIPTELHGWQESAGGKRIGLIYTNGFGGANSMLLVGPAPVRETPSVERETVSRRVYCASAADAESFRAKIKADLDFLENVPEADFGALCFTSSCRQHTQDRYRMAVVAGTKAELATALQRHLEGNGHVPSLWLGESLRTKTVRPLQPVGNRSAEDCAADFAGGEDIAMSELFTEAERRMVRLPRYRISDSSSWPVSLSGREPEIVGKP